MAFIAALFLARMLVNCADCRAAEAACGPVF